MAYDQSFIPKDLRPLNTTRVSVEETGIAMVSTSGRSPEGFYRNLPSGGVSSPQNMLVYYSVNGGSDMGFGGLSFGNGNPSVNLGVGGTMPMWDPRVPVPAVGQPLVSLPPGYMCSPNVVARVGGDGTDQGGEDSVSGKKVKFLCSFGGRILPRPSDGMLRYVGGETRIVGIRRDARFSELAQKMVDVCRRPVIIKYQLPGEDLDALVSVSCQDDFENMMEEYEKLAERTPDGSAKLRVFLFSASEIDACSVMEFGDLQDSGQRYVDAINGVADGIGGGFTRKESIASVTSTQNSDLSAQEVVDASLISVDIAVPPPITVVSPKCGNPTSYNDDVATPLCADPNSVVHVDSPRSVHVDSPRSGHVVPVAASGSPRTVPSQPAITLDRTTPLPAQQQQMGYDFHQGGTRFPPPLSAYLQSFVDPQQDATARAQIVYGNPQAVAAARPVLIQPQYHDNSSTFVPRPFIPAVPVTMAPSTSSHFSMNPNMMAPLMQHPIAVAADQNFASFHTQIPPVAVGGGYGWRPVPPMEPVAFSEGWIPHEQVMLSDRIPRAGDCYMCQKQLPHAHSDPVVQEQRDNILRAADINHVYHSMRLDDMNRFLQGNRIVPCATSGEGIFEQKESGTGVKVLGQINNGGSPQAKILVTPQNFEVQDEIDEFVPKWVNDADLVKMLAPHGVTGLPDVQAPYGPVKGKATESLLEGAALQHVASPLQEIKHEVLMTKPVDCNNAAVGPVALKKPDLRDPEIAKDHSRIIPGVPFGEDISSPAIAYDAVRAIDGTEQLHARPSEIVSCSEQSKSPVGALDLISQLNSGNVNFSKPMVPETNQTKPSELMPCSTAEAAFQHSGRPVESYEVSQVPIFRRDDAVTYHQNVAPVGMKNSTTIGMVQSSVSQSSWTANNPDSANSLFSNQDPWNSRHDSPFPPPKPGKIAIRNETPSTRAPLHETGPGNTEAKTGVDLLDVFNLPPANTNRDHNILEQAQAGKEEHVKQELQATAEGVAASVLQSYPPSIPDSSSNERLGTGVSREKEAQDTSDAVVQTRLEGMNIKPAKATSWFPLADGLGRLQIIKNSDLEELRELGSGTFGTVYHGKWRGTDVAIKRINERCFAGKPSEEERMRNDFWNEAIKLADLHHPNVVAFYGVVLDGPGGSVATVTEYMVNGSLRNALQKSERNLDKRKRLLISMDVAFGMEYLHAKNIVHFDLKSDNLLVNLRDPHRPICKVGDLGLSKAKCKTLISGGVRGTLPWMAPELLNGSSNLVSEKVDVFSFGIVMWELLTGEEPYADLHYGAIIGGIVSNTLRPPAPGNCDPDWRLLMERCWSNEPSERPSFTEIVNELRVMASKIPPKGQSSATSARPTA